MSVSSWALGEDLSTPALVAVALVLVLALVLLALELRQRERFGLAITVTGVLGLLLLGAAVLRPVRVTTRGSMLGPRVVILVDQSRRLLLPAAGTTRRELALKAAADVSAHFSDARTTVLGFGDSGVVPLSPSKNTPGTRLSTGSDLGAAISALAETPSERPEAIVVVSDGRLTRPGADANEAAIRERLGALGVPVHTLSVVRDAPKDASIRRVRAAGAAVAHQPLALTVEIGCAGGLECGEVPVTVRELRSGVEPAVLATGSAKVEQGTATLDLNITLERAGARIVEVSIDAPEGDQIPDNDTRRLAFVVTRDRVRLLHVAGRPTYDVRALRMWLKSDEAVDLVAFFILRGSTDDPGAIDSELALIPFPVDELFTEHLGSFDAVILQDINAIEYRFAQYLPALAEYVRSGGGLIMVGGPSSFVGGGYADSALNGVLPVTIPGSSEKPFDTAEFVPRYTEAGREAPVLRGLRELFGEELPSMVGSNTLGPARSGAIVLWEHSQRRVGDRPMPMLALGEAGDGRSIALGVDGTHALAFSELASKVAGRGYGALWDGLVGWLMRDPRYEAAHIDLTHECIAGEPLTLRLVRLPGEEADVELTLEKLGAGGDKPRRFTAKAPAQGPIEIDVGALEAGGYTARARIGAAPPTRQDFACERGGEAWSDSRPDPERLARIASATGGLAFAADEIGKLPIPEPKQVAAERHVSPVLPPWVWTLAASAALGVHWLFRRKGGLA